MKCAVLGFAALNTNLPFFGVYFVMHRYNILNILLKAAMRYLLSCILAFTCIAVMHPSAHAAKTIKASKPTKERLVLMPLRVPDEDKNLQGSMETALVQGMQQRYEVFSGEQVAQKAKAIFFKESRATAKKECDEIRCMQDIAIAFQAELIATANVTKRDGGYFLALSIQNIFDNKVVYSNSVACENCSTFQVVNKLKELSGTTATVAADLPAPVISGNKNDPEAVMWTEAQRGNTLDDYQVYLDSYPKGKYLAFAKARIKKISDAAEAAAEQQQQQAWGKAQKENSEASYGIYLKDYPNGRFVGFAKMRLEKLKNDVAFKEEVSLWNKADSNNDKTAIQSYLDKYSRGRYVTVATAKLKYIKDEEAKEPIMVRIPDNNYEMGKYEVTQAEWRVVMGSNPPQLEFINCGDTCPVERVSWNDVQEFLQKLNAKTGKQYRLPTEVEWLYACYGGNKTEYCGSNDINAVAWYESNSNKTIHPVGQKKSNGYGLYDMSGNVSEWLSDCSSSGCDNRVIGGGSWNFTPQLIRAALSYGYATLPSIRLEGAGFRLARTLP